MTLVMKLIGRQDEIAAFLRDMERKGFVLDNFERQHWNVDRCALYADVQGARE